MTKNNFQVTAIAGADLSSSINLWVGTETNLAAAEVVNLATDASLLTVLGVLAQNADDAAVATVITSGLATAKAGETLEPFDLVTVGASGLTYKATTGDVVCGRYLGIAGGQAATGAPRDAAANDLISIEVFPNKAPGVRSLDPTTATLSFSTIATAAVGSATATVSGAAIGDVVEIGIPTLATGLGVFTPRVSAADTVTVTVYNGSGATQNAFSESAVIYVKKADLGI